MDIENNLFYMLWKSFPLSPNTPQLCKLLQSMVCDSQPMQMLFDRCEGSPSKQTAIYRLVQCLCLGGGDRVCLWVGGWVGGIN